MCGRYVLTTPSEAIAAVFHLADFSALSPRWNIAPSQMIAAVRAEPVDSGPPRRALRLLRWGLIPAWADDPSIANRLINCRSESAAVKPSFRAAFRARRCVIPADGFYEWAAEGRGRGARKTPMYVRPAMGGLMPMAGLWERWVSPSGQPIETCTILTTEPNTTLRPLHDRMPAILPDAPSWDAWLDPDTTDPARLMPLLRAAPDDLLIYSPVGPRVNSPRNEGSECLASPAGNDHDPWQGLFDQQP